MRIARPIFLLAFVFLIGCAARLPSQKVYLPKASLDAVLAAMRGREEAVQSLKALSLVEVQRQGSRINLREAIILDAPRSLRFETLGLGGLPILVMAMDGERVFLDSIRDRLFLVGRADSQTLARLVGIDLEPEHMVRLLMGKPPLGPEFPGSSLSLMKDLKRDSLFLIQDSPPLVQRLLINQKSLAVEEGEVYRDGVLLFRFSFQGLRDLKGIQFPYKISIEKPGILGIRVEYKTVDVGTPLSRDLFRLHVPQGYRVIDLDQEPYKEEY